MQHLKVTSGVDVIKSLEPVWLEVATSLKLHPIIIEKITSLCQEPSECSHAMIEVWLDRKPPNHATWRILLEILRKHEKEDIASAIEKGRKSDAQGPRSLVVLKQPSGEEEVLSQEHELAMAKLQEKEGVKGCPIDAQQDQPKSKDEEIKALQRQIATLKGKVEAAEPHTQGLDRCRAHNSIRQSLL